MESETPRRDTLSRCQVALCEEELLDGSSGYYPEVSNGKGGSSRFGVCRSAGEALGWLPEVGVHPRVWLNPEEKKETE